MKSSLRHRNRRLNRRIPVVSPAAILLKNGQRIEAQCVELGVGGMTLNAAYVPSESETLRVEVLSPAESQVERPPLLVDVIVRRCHALDEEYYELGCEIVEILT